MPFTQASPRPSPRSSARNTISPASTSKTNRRACTCASCTSNVARTRSPQEVVFRPTLTEGSLEVFTGEDGAETEQVFYSWFATGDGEVKEFRSLEPVDGRPGDPASTYETPKTPQRITVYVVARDGRGGVGWLSREVDAGP